jgi:AraC-like DNA-binding protein
MVGLSRRADLPDSVAGLSSRANVLDGDQMHGRSIGQQSIALKRVPGELVAKGRIRVATVIPVPGLLQEHGIDPVPVLAELGLALTDFAEPETTIPFPTMGRLLATSARLTNCPHFGLMTGARQQGSALGAVGFLVQSASDVRTGLAILVRHFQMHNPNAVIDVQELDSYVAFKFTILPDRIEGREQILDGAMAIAFNLIRALCGPDWRATEVRFAHARPENVAPFRRFFGTTLRFDAAETALIFHRRWLDQRVATADPALHAIMATRVVELESEPEKDLVATLRRLLPGLVTERAASIGVAADRVGLSARTLSRRLAAEGTPFLQLREEACRSLAVQLLERTRMPAGEIAHQLGYSNPSAFTRAFRRWTGLGPLEWRASRRRRSTAPAKGRNRA